MNPITPQNAAEVAKNVKDSPVQSAGSVRRSLSITALAAAMVNVQKDIEDPVKNKRADAGTRGKYRYADLVTVLDVVRPTLTLHGFAVMQFPCELDGEAALTTQLIHQSGEWVETTVKIRPVQKDPQSIGSALTYARRYALLALCGIAADDDDDGKAGSRPAPAQTQQPQPSARASENPKPASAPPAQLTPPTEYAKGILDKLAVANSRAEGVPLWNQFDTDHKAGKVTPHDKVHLDTGFRKFSERFPAQQTAGVK